MFFSEHILKLAIFTLEKFKQNRRFTTLSVGTVAGVLRPLDGVETLVSALSGNRSRLKTN